MTSAAVRHVVIRCSLRLLLPDIPCRVMNTEALISYLHICPHAVQPAREKQTNTSIHKWSFMFLSIPCIYPVIQPFVLCLPKVHTYIYMRLYASKECRSVFQDPSQSCLSHVQFPNAGVSAVGGELMWLVLPAPIYSICHTSGPFQKGPGVLE